MSRLVVRNSSLVYPPIPDRVRRDDDIVIPLVDRFEDAVFMPGPGYDTLRGLFPEFNLRVRRLAHEIGQYLPEWLGEPVEDFGHSAWEAYADHFAKFSLGPLLANAFIIDHAIALQPERVFAWELPDTSGWWAGRQMVAEAAEAIAAECDVPVELSAPGMKRVVRDSIVPAARTLRALRHFHQMAGVDLPRPTAPADVVFVLAGPTLVPLFDRIGARLQSEHGLRVAALDTPLGGPSRPIAEGQLPRASLHGYSTPAMTRKGIWEVLQAAGEFAETAEQVLLWPEVQALPRPLQEVLARRIHTAMVEELPVCLYQARLWQAALDALRPSVVVAFNSYNEILAPGVLQAQERDIPTICLQHGIWGPLLLAGALLPYDDVVVFGEYARGILSPIAGRHSQFVQTGHCMYDDLDLSVEHSGLRAEMLADRKHLIVVTTQPIERRLMANETRWWLRGMAEASASLDALLAIKPHPHEDHETLALYAELQREWPETVRVVPHGELPLTELIAACDLLVTRFSTTAFEAALLRKPVMTVNLSGGPDQYPFAEEGCAVGVHDYEELHATLARMLTDRQLLERLAESQQSFLERHLGPRDGRATERIAARIAARAEKGRSLTR